MTPSSTHIVPIDTSFASCNNTMSAQPVVQVSSVSDYFSNLLDTSAWPARWGCGQWSETEGWFYILSDLTIFLSYSAIPMLLIFFYWKYKKIPFGRFFILFGVFILACGFTHLIDVVLFWEPVYRLSGFVKFLTAVISLFTALAMVRAIPIALSMKTEADYLRILESKELLEKEIAKRTLSLSETNQELESFSYSVSHDLRAPLRAMQGYSSALLEDVGSKLDEQETNYLKRIIRNSNKMGKLIDDLLSFSRMSRSTESIEIFSLDMLVKNILLDNYFKLDVSIFEIGTLGSIKGDKDMIKQVFENLISNAVKYSSNVAEPKIKIWSESDKKDNIIHIEDNGIGFDQQYENKLYEVFQRLHSDSEFEGTGVGLSLCKKIIDRHHGTITAKGVINKGAKFTIALPK
ncbi:ATP-binding protein [Reichenbachiella agarivorans]|uniref:histidine kinase n=1 Tax=Reichenbachiella agarivorans TaxID=2979464 RepID=A0ABY6CJX8_9BACT|nr:ATP-binding protein [Reichenbachiella agarivorans]UXP30826.1 ATP-binding protein [Reichenbachiella agarivorans]